MSGPEPPDRVTVGVVLLNERGEVLLQLRDDRLDIADPACWVVPGGGLEDGETLEDGARREFLEETGYRLDELVHVLTRDLARQGGSLERQAYFLARYDGVRPLTCYEGQELRFISTAALLRMRTSPGLHSVIAEALSQASDR